MTNDARRGELMALEGALSAVWPLLTKHLYERKAAHIANLVAANNEELRGRIKELNELLELPERLRQEALSLQHPQEEAELP